MNYQDFEPEAGRQHRSPDWAQAAANDSAMSDDDKLPAGLRNLPDLMVTCRQVLDAPEDLPMSDLAFRGLTAAIRILQSNLPGVNLLADQIACVTPAATESAAGGATILALSRRVGKHLLYNVAIEVGHALAKGKPLNEVALGTFGAWCLQRLLLNDFPSGSSISKVLASLARPDSQHARAWSDKARTRAHGRALCKLDEAIKSHETAASQYGLHSLLPRVVRSSAPVDVFNREFRRRVDNLTDFSTMNAVAGSGGYGTLSAAGLLDVGRDLMLRVRMDDSSAALVCLEVISHLPSQTTLKLPLLVEGEPPKGALAWIDVRRGLYCHILYRLVERCARPAAGTENLYEKTTQTVTVTLSPFLHEFICRKVNLTGGLAIDLQQLLGSVGHHPRSSVVGSGVYRCTARRLQESIPALLLQAGHHRWTVALATNSHFLVSRGRPVYGACRASDIDVTMNSAYGLLGWPTVPSKSTLELVGSFTTPSSMAVASALNFLADEADSTPALEECDHPGLIRVLNLHVQWFSLMLALGYALRTWLQYDLRADELRAGGNLHFDDKDLHEHKGPPVPTASLVHRAILGWYALCRSVAGSLTALGDPQSLALADCIEQRLEDCTSVESVFSIDAVGRLESVGCHTWDEALAPSIRLRPSFARQFWPMQLIRLGVEQQVMDMLMRHQVDGLHPRSSHSVRQLDIAASRLKTCLDEVLKSLELRTPKRFLEGGA